MPTMVLKLTILGDDDDVEIQEHYAHAVTNDWQTFVELVREKYGNVAEQLMSIPSRQIGIFSLNGVKAFVFSSDSPISSNGIMLYAEVMCIDLASEERRSKIEFEGRNPIIRRMYRYTWHHCYKYTCRHT